MVADPCDATPPGPEVASFIPSLEPSLQAYRITVFTVKEPKPYHGTINQLFDNNICLLSTDPPLPFGLQLVLVPNRSQLFGMIQDIYHRVSASRHPALLLLGPDLAIYPSSTGKHNCCYHDKCQRDKCRKRHPGDLDYIPPHQIR